jgi:hypothetical protein
VLEPGVRRAAGEEEQVWGAEREEQVRPRQWGALPPPVYRAESTPEVSPPESVLVSHCSCSLAYPPMRNALSMNAFPPSLHNLCQSINIRHAGPIAVFPAFRHPILHFRMVSLVGVSVWYSITMTRQ